MRRQIDPRTVTGDFRYVDKATDSWSRDWGVPEGGVYVSSTNRFLDDALLLVEIDGDVVALDVNAVTDTGYPWW